MISFKTPLHYKFYFLGNAYRIFYTWGGRFFLIYFIAFSIWFGSARDYYFALMMLSIPLVFIFILPLIKLIYARSYYKFTHIEYFFDDDSFGYRMGDYKMEIKKQNIEYIKIRPNLLLIKIVKNRLFFVIDNTNVANIKEQLLKSEYKKFLKN